MIELNVTQWRETERFQKDGEIKDLHNITISIALGHTNVPYLCTRRDYREINDLISSWPYKIKSFITDFELIWKHTYA